MNFITKASLKQIAVAASVLVLSSNAVFAAGFLDKIKNIEKGIDTITKPPKAQADVGGVKVDFTKCSAKTGSKTIDNATGKKTDGKCGSDKETPQKASAPKKQQTTYDDEDTSPDR